MSVERKDLITENENGSISFGDYGLDRRQKQSDLR